MLGVEGNDAMQFNKNSIAVPTSCKQFTVKLKAGQSYAWFCSFPGHSALMKAP